MEADRRASVPRTVVREEHKWAEKNRKKIRQAVKAAAFFFCCGGRGWRVLVRQVFRALIGYTPALSFLFGLYRLRTLLDASLEV